MVGHLYHSALSHPYSGEQGEKIQWKKKKSFWVEIRSSLFKGKKKKKKGHTTAKRWTSYSLLPISKQCSAMSWEAWPQYTHTSCSGRQTLSQRGSPLLFPLLQLYLLSIISYNMEHPLCQFRSVVLVTSTPHQLLEGRVRIREGLDAVQTLFSNS